MTASVSANGLPALTLLKTIAGAPPAPAGRERIAVVPPSLQTPLQNMASGYTVALHQFDDTHGVPDGTVWAMIEYTCHQPMQPEVTP